MQDDDELDEDEDGEEEEVELSPAVKARVDALEVIHVREAACGVPQTPFSHTRNLTSPPPPSLPTPLRPWHALPPPPSPPTPPCSD